MHIKKFVIEGLFKYLNYTISFNDGINIIHGINGKGKTTILNIITNILNGELAIFYQLSFKRIRVEFNDSMYLNIYRDTIDNKSKILFDYQLKNDKEFIGKDVSNGNSTKAFKKKLRFTPLLLPAQRVSLVETYYHDDRNRMRNEFIQSRSHTIFERRLYAQDGRKFDRSPIFEPLPNMIDIHSIPSFIIERARKFSFLISRSFNEYDNKLFEDFFEKILIKQTNKDIFENENSLNLIEEIKIAKDKYFESYKNHYKRSKILETIESHISNFSNESNEINIFLNLYLVNINKKNSAIERFITPFIEFESIVNTLFSGKKLQISITNNVNNIFKIISEANENIGIQYLSSGEKNLLLIFYHYMFEMKDQTLFMIDEPELSLHIDWQAKIISFFEQHSRGNQVIVVTHSPDILQNHRNYEINLDKCRV